MTDFPRPVYPIVYSFINASNSTVHTVARDLADAYDQLPKGPHRFTYAIDAAGRFVYG
jgi:hypothetical protein